MNCFRPGADQFLHGVNLSIRTGKPETRPGVRRHWKSDAAGLDPAFWFNADNAKYNDGTHTGFWFAWDWVRTLWGSVQGFGVVRFPWETEDTMMIVTEGKIYRVYRGYMTSIACSEPIAGDESVNIVQAFDKVIIFRGAALQPLGWDGDDAGFVLVPDAAVGDDIPWVEDGLLHPGGRLWVAEGRDAVLCSDIMDYTEWDRVYQMFSISPGDGDEIMAIATFHEDNLLVFKRNSISVLTGINAVVDLDGGEQLSDFVATSVVDAETGLVARRGFVTVGEDVWYLGRGGIYSLSRNVQNKIQRQAVPLSSPVQTLVSRINWSAVSGAVAGLIENHVIFAVPIDGSAVNNALIVYDLLAPGSNGLGAWAGLWTSKGRIFDVRRFFRLNLQDLYLDGDGIARKLFADCCSDSDEGAADVPEWDAAARYNAGDAARLNSTIYTALRTTTGESPDATPAAWVAETDPQRFFDIETELKSRFYTLGDGMPSMRAGRGELLASHHWPLVDVDVWGDQNGASEELFADVEWDDTAFDVADKGTFDPATDADDLTHAYRSDYAALVGSAGVQIGGGGMSVGQMKLHNLRFIRHLLKDRGWGMTIRNRRGRLRLESVAMPVELRRHAFKQTV
jgi:hypothetical protein